MAKYKHVQQKIPVSECPRLPDPFTHRHVWMLLLTAPWVRGNFQNLRETQNTAPCLWRMRIQHHRTSLIIKQHCCRLWFGAVRQQAIIRVNSVKDLYRYITMTQWVHYASVHNVFCDNTWCHKALFRSAQNDVSKSVNQLEPPDLTRLLKFIKSVSVIILLILWFIYS